MKNLEPLIETVEIPTTPWMATSKVAISNRNMDVDMDMDMAKLIAQVYAGLTCAHERNSVAEPTKAEQMDEKRDELRLKTKAPDARDP